MEEYRGVTNLYDWQKECLKMTSVSNGANLVYSLPTSGGKTLVAEILMLKELLINGKNVLFILPFVSIVQEKMSAFTPLGLELGFWVEEYTGSRGRIPPVKRTGSYSILIATIEKAHSIINSLIDTKSLGDIGLVIVDELHMIGEGGSRGACLEMSLTKLRIVSPRTRIIGMSATLPNVTDLTQFLNSELYVSNFRPVKLFQYIKVGDHLYELDTSKLNLPMQEGSLNDCLIHKRMLNFQYNKRMKDRDPDNLVGMVAEVILGHTIESPKINGNHFAVCDGTAKSKRPNSCLVFCPTKVHCENTARMLAELLPPTACFPSDCGETKEDIIERRRILLDNLRLDNIPESNDVQLNINKNSPTCCPVLECTIPHGVAYHHSGLTQEERNALECAYSEGVIRVICCTSTLAAGVNLPAKRVIIRKPYIGSAFISSTQYQQMIGRAGRAGLHNMGESITILQPTDQLAFIQMISTLIQTSNCGAQLSNVTNANRCLDNKSGLCTSSLLYDNGKGLRQFLLSLIGLEIAVTYSDILRACEKTLLGVQSNASMDQDLETLVRDELQQLITLNLILTISTGALLTNASPCVNTRKSLERSRFEATKLGRAAVKGGIDSDRIGSLMHDLRLAACAINTSGPLHLLYLVTPPDVVDQIQVDWNKMFDRVNILPSSETNLITLLGFPEGYILWKATGQSIRRKLDERPLRRLYVALILAELWENRSTIPIWYISESYKISRGTIQSLLTSASSVASSLAHALSSEFSTDSELWAFAYLLPEFATRLAYCVSSELLPLMELPGVKRARARQLYNVGYCSLKDIACTEVSELTARLAPHLTSRLAKEIIGAAQMLVSERANSLYQEASQMLSGLKTKTVLSQMADNLKIKPFSPQLMQSSKIVTNGSEIDDSFNTPTDNDEDLFA